MKTNFINAFKADDVASLAKDASDSITWLEVHHMLYPGVCNKQSVEWARIIHPLRQMFGYKTPRKGNEGLANRKLVKGRNSRALRFLKTFALSNTNNSIADKVIATGKFNEMARLDEHNYANLLRGNVEFSCGDDWLKDKNNEGNEYLPGGNKFSQDGKNVQAYWDSIRNTWRFFPDPRATCQDASGQPENIGLMMSILRDDSGKFPNAVVICKWFLEQILGNHWFLEVAEEPGRRGTRTRHLEELYLGSFSAILFQMILQTKYFGHGYCTGPHIHLFVWISGHVC